MTIIASDLEVTMMATLTIEAEKNGNITIPARILTETLKTFTNQPLTFVIDTETFSVEMISEMGNYKLAGQNADEFPKIPKQGTETVSMGLFNQLKLLGISEVKNNDYEWLKVEIKQKIIKPMALFIPGVSKNSISKQWEPVKFAKVASYLENIGYTICVIGTDNDKQSIFPIINECKNALNMINKSPPEIIYSLSLEAKIIFSNDTGPGHIAALSKNNIIWIGNQNRISRANLDNNKNFHKLLSSSVKNISHEEVINFINDKNLI